MRDAGLRRAPSEILLPVSPNASKVAVLFTYGPPAYLFYPFDFGHHVVGGSSSVSR